MASHKCGNMVTADRGDGITLVAVLDREEALDLVDALARITEGELPGTSRETRQLLLDMHGALSAPFRVTG